MNRRNHTAGPIPGQPHAKRPHPGPADPGCGQTDRQLRDRRLLSLRLLCISDIPLLIAICYCALVYAVSFRKDLVDQFAA
jgi:hypothetical protein